MAYHFHGHSRDKLYDVRRTMIRRCENPADKNYKQYGARGIKVCSRWKKSVANFIKDMGPKPTPQHTVDRIDNDGPYSPENCRWATRKEQSNNRRPLGKKAGAKAARPTTK